MELGCAVESLENAEQFIGVLHVEANPIVADEDCRVAIFFERANLDNEL